MKLLDLTLDTPPENLALDDALLEEAEAGGVPAEVLRVWESPDPCVVVGRSSRVSEEVNILECQRDNVAVLRRCSGGAAIVAGPGCLMYAVVLSYELRPQLRMISEAHQFVLQRIRRSLQHCAPLVRCQGTSDLTLEQRKFSGNSLRCKRTHLLYHGTLLYDFPLDAISRYLLHPPRQPDYRQDRVHNAFVANLDVPRDALRDALIDNWQTEGPLDDWPRARTRELVAARYAQPSWNCRL
jgi:lipoate-protein ligase A